MKKLTVLLLVLIAGCASRPTAEEIRNADYGRIILQEECQQYAQSRLVRILKDPESARFQFGTCEKGWMPAVPIFGYPKQFGYRMEFLVNAKNSFGGYVGNTPYVILINNGVVLRCQSNIAGEVPNKC